MGLSDGNPGLFPTVPLLAGGDFPFVPVQGLGKSRALLFLSGNKDASVHLGFDLSGPGLGGGLRVKSPGDPVEPLPFDDCPPGSASFLERCHLRSSSR